MHLSEAAVIRNTCPPGIVINEELTDNPPNLQAFCEAYVDSENKVIFSIETQNIERIVSFFTGK